jgi:flagellar L-ring protein precursor FlgH
MPGPATLPRAARLAAMLLGPALLAGCGAAERIADIGSPPAMSAIENPVTDAAYQPVALPMPRPTPVAFQANSLWRPGARAFFKDQRASVIGDILTVNIAIDDEAQIANETQRIRESEEDSDLTNILGYEGSLGQILPEAVNPASLVSLGSESNARGRGTTNRSESVNLVVAAIVTQVLPNGNLVITGRQEVRVNFEMRILTITGVVRPEDITATNTIRHTQIAEARISYGGRGQLTDVQQPRYGQQLFDIVFPF